MRAIANAAADRWPATVSPAEVGRDAMNRNAAGPSGSPTRRIQMSVLVFASCPFGESAKLSIRRTLGGAATGASTTADIAPPLVRLTTQVRVEVPRIIRYFSVCPGWPLELYVACCKLDLGHQQA